MNENNKFKVINEQGEEIICEVLFTFESEETKKNYMVYTDNTRDDEGKIKVFASIYNTDEKDGSTKLFPVESEKEWQIIETIVDSISEESRKNASN